MLKERYVLSKYSYKKDVMKFYCAICEKKAKFLIWDTDMERIKYEWWFESVCSKECFEYWKLKEC